MIKWCLLICKVTFLLGESWFRMIVRSLQKMSYSGFHVIVQMDPRAADVKTGKKVTEAPIYECVAG